MQVFILDIFYGPYHMVHMKLGDDMGPLKCLNYKRLNMVWQVQVCRLDKFKLRIVYPAQKSLKYLETIKWGRGDDINVYP